MPNALRRDYTQLATKRIALKYHGQDCDVCPVSADCIERYDEACAWPSALATRLPCGLMPDESNGVEAVI